MYRLPVLVLAAAASACSVIDRVPSDSQPPDEQDRSGPLDPAPCSDEAMEGARLGFRLEGPPDTWWAGWAEVGHVSAGESSGGVELVFLDGEERADLSVSWGARVAGRLEGKLAVGDLLKVRGHTPDHFGHDNGIDALDLSGRLVFALSDGPVRPWGLGSLEGRIELGGAPCDLEKGGCGDLLYRGIRFSSSDALIELLPGEGALAPSPQGELRQHLGQPKARAARPGGRRRQRLRRRRRRGSRSEVSGPARHRLRQQGLHLLHGYRRPPRRARPR